MTCPLAGHDLVAIGTVVHPDLLKYALGINKYPPKRRDTELELFLKKKKTEKSIWAEEHHIMTCRPGHVHIVIVHFRAI